MTTAIRTPELMFRDGLLVVEMTREISSRRGRLCQSLDHRSLNLVSTRLFVPEVANFKALRPSASVPRSGRGLEALLS